MRKYRPKAKLGAPHKRVHMSVVAVVAVTGISKYLECLLFRDYAIITL